MSLQDDKIRSLEAEVARLKEKLSRSVTWSIEDFETVANEQEISKNTVIYDRSKFEEALRIMVHRHDATIGISWDTVEFWLDEVCTLKND